jgi:hypothetical protein
MATRIASLLFSISLLPLIVPAQTPAQTPAEEAEQVLRARVTEFLQYHVEGNFRKAYDMVADDTKDAYFNMGKAQIKAFKIGAVTLTDNFTKATVLATISRTMNIMGQDLPVQVPSTTTWKLENGKWVWHNDVQTAPSPIPFPNFVPNAAPPVASGKSIDNGDAGLPKEFNDKTIADSARSILQQVQVDKKEITLAIDRPSEEQVIFHNGMTGSVQLELTAPDMPGFTAKLEQAVVRAAADAHVIFRYEPVDRAQRRDFINVQLTVQPLDQVFAIRVNFAAK